MSIQLQPVQVATGHPDHDGKLVFSNDVLVAVLVHLSDMHETDAGKWYLEAGFGRVVDRPKMPFADLDEAQDWIVGQLHRAR